MCHFWLSTCVTHVIDVQRHTENFSFFLKYWRYWIGFTKIFYWITDETDPRHHHHLGLHHEAGPDSKSSTAGIPIPPSKPKIWSLADTAVCKTPPPPTSASTSANQYQQQMPPHSQAYLSPSTWAGAHNFSQFAVDPAMMRLRHHGNMLGMGYMGLPPPPEIGGGAGGGQQSDTPPHTPPTLKSSGQFGAAGAGYNGLHNGYSQMSPSAAGNQNADSKVFPFNSSAMNNTSFKMM